MPAISFNSPVFGENALQYLSLTDLSRLFLVGKEITSLVASY